MYHPPTYVCDRSPLCFLLPSYPHPLAHPQTRPSATHFVEPPGGNCNSDCLGTKKGSKKKAAAEAAEVAPPLPETAATAASSGERSIPALPTAPATGSVAEQSAVGMDVGAFGGGSSAAASPAEVVEGKKVGGVWEVVIGCRYLM